MKSQTHVYLYDSASLRLESAGFKAFQEGFYQHVVSLGCNKCHDSNVSPYFASANVNIAYSYATGKRNAVNEKLIDFTNPQSSIFISYSGNAHCGDTPCSDPDNQNTVKAYLEAWAAAELESNGDDTPVNAVRAKYLTSSIRVPSSIPPITSAVPAVIRFELNRLNIGVQSLQNAILEVEIQMSGTNTYRINKPKIIGSTSALRFVGIRVYIKNTNDVSILGREDLSYANHWHNVSSIANPVTRPTNLPGGPITTATPITSSTLYYSILQGENFLTIGFDDITQP